MRWFAHRVQKPWEKPNQAIVLGGAQRIGKDSWLEPIKSAVGPWNLAEVSPQQIMSRFNGFTRCVILRISEGHDRGEHDRYQFYEHLKVYIAAPPDVLTVDVKFREPYAILNLCGVVITTNHKTDGIYLPPDDGRHLVAWSDVTREAFSEDDWRTYWRWLDHEGGRAFVSHYLAALDLSKFNPKAPPPRTAAWQEIVNSSLAPEDEEMRDTIERIINDVDHATKAPLLPDVLILEEIKSKLTATSSNGSATARTAARWRSGSRPRATSRSGTKIKKMGAGR